MHTLHLETLTPCSKHWAGADADECGQLGFRDIPSPPAVDHVPLYGPMYGRVYRTGLVTWCLTPAQVRTLMSRKACPSLPEKRFLGVGLVLGFAPCKFEPYATRPPDELWLRVSGPEVGGWRNQKKLDGAALQGYLAHKKQSSSEDHRRNLGIVLL